VGQAISKGNEAKSKMKHSSDMCKESAGELAVAEQVQANNISL